MRADPTAKYQLKTQKQGRVNLQFSDRKLRRGQERSPIVIPTLRELYERALAGLHRLLVAVKYRFYQATAGFFENIRFPWFKVGVAALAIFIAVKKDIHFSVNMQAPLGAIGDDREENNVRADEMSLVRTVSAPGTAGSRAALLPSLDELDEHKVRAYIKRFSKVAAAEMEKFGIPASVKMAQAILESGAGNSPAARQTNNHFGAPMAGAAYNSAWENWRAHSLLVSEEYAAEDWGANYKKWARGLEQAGYNKEKGYGDRLLEVIDAYQLYQLDEW